MIATIAFIVGALLYRIRGGWLKPHIGTQVSRLLWALPTAGLIFWLADLPLWTLAALTVSVFASMALLGHGAHMIYDYGMAVSPAHPKTELLTRAWLPKLFDGVPNPGWSADEVSLYNMTGMNAIGVVRNLIALLPLVTIAPLLVAIYTATGLLHGPLYWAGWRIRGGDIQVAELLVGGVSWATLALLFGGFK